MTMPFDFSSHVHLLECKEEMNRSLGLTRAEEYDGGERLEHQECFPEDDYNSMPQYESQIKRGVRT